MSDSIHQSSAPAQHPAPASMALFSYGTLQKSEVQLANFARLLDGRPDRLPGYKTSMLEITDPQVLRQSGQRYHPIVQPSSDPADGVDGTVFAITPAELAAADAYEVDDYARVLVTLQSGTQAWVYMQKT